MKLTDTLTEQTIILPLSASTKLDSVKELLNRLLNEKYLTATTKLFSLIDEHDKLLNSAVGKATAIHYSSSVEINNPVSVFGVSKKGIDYNSPDSQKVHFIFLILDSVNNPVEHRKIITRFQHFINEHDMKSKILSSDSSNDIMEMIVNWEEEYLFNEKV